MSWHDERLTVFDLETTSANPEEARIVTAAIGYVGGGQPTDLTTLVAAVDVEIPDEAAAIHGWTTERARREGMAPEDVVDIVLGYLDRRPDGSAVVAFNTPYDLTVLDREIRRFGLDAIERSRPLYVVDPLVIDRHLDRYRRGKRNLAAAAAHYRAAHEAAHHAGADAIAAGRLAWVLAKRGEVIRDVRSDEEWVEVKALAEEWARVRNDLPTLHDAERRWAADQAERLEAYFHKGNAKKGVPPQPERTVARDWPIIPLGGAV